MTKKLRVLSSMAPREVLGETAQLYWERHGIGVDLEAAGGVDVARRVAAGESVDIVVLASDAIDKLAGSGRVLQAGRTDLMTSEIAIAVRTGAPHPPIADEESVKRLVRDAPSISYSTGPSGTYLEKLFSRWGLLDRLRPRIVVPRPGIPVARLIADGEAALGFQQLSELRNVSGVDVVGSLPAAIQLSTTFTAGVCSSCDDSAEASRFLRFAASDATDMIKQHHGMTAIK